MSKFATLLARVYTKVKDPMTGFFMIKKEFIRKEIYLILIWFFFFLGMAIFMPHKEDRFLLGIIPAISLISGYFISKIKRYQKVIILLILLVLVFSVVNNFYTNYSTYHNTNTECFNEVVSELQNLPGTFMMISENPPLFRDSIKQESSYYPDNLNEETIKKMGGLEKGKVYFIFTKFNSGFETEKWKNIKEIMNSNYNLEFECSKDSEVNWIYSN